jgi:hypothetical protein
MRRFGALLRRFVDNDQRTEHFPLQTVTNRHHAGVTLTHKGRLVWKNEGYRRVVARVAILEGGIERLAVRLNVSSGLVTRGIEGLAAIPSRPGTKSPHWRG